MALGVPVMASNVTAIPEVVGDAGILLDPDKPEDWAYWIDKIMKDEKLRAELIKKGKVRAAQFTWENFAKGMVESIHEIPSINIIKIKNKMIHF